VLLLRLLHVEAHANSQLICTISFADVLTTFCHRFETAYKKDSADNKQGFSARRKKQFPTVFTIIPVSGYPSTLTHGVNYVRVSYPRGKDSELLLPGEHMKLPI
jgi:hypothetical protein